MESELDELKERLESKLKEISTQNPHFNNVCNCMLEKLRHSVANIQIVEYWVNIAASYSKENLEKEIDEISKGLEATHEILKEGEY